MVGQSASTVTKHGRGQLLVFWFLMLGV